MNAKSAVESVPVAIRFVDNVDGTITDLRTGLQWSQRRITPKPVNHAKAIKACAELELGGFTDWRLPTVEELFFLADRSRRNPAIDTDFFPDFEVDWYWSSTLFSGASSDAWIVGFGYGLSYCYYRLDACDVLAVRSAGQ